jgi:hypothetical protein
MEEQIEEFRNHSDESYNYMLLGRLQQDCLYFLDNGNKNVKHLWADSVKDQITKMKELHDGFAQDKKPEWLTYKQILELEELMTFS